jgi:nucleoside-diphosphate-sugar epimerase
MKRVQFAVFGKHPLLLAVRDHLILSGFELVSAAAVDPNRQVFVLFGAEAHTDEDAEKIRADYWLTKTSWPVILLSSSSVYSDRDYALNLREAVPMDEADGHVITSPLDPGAIRPLTALMSEHLFVQRDDAKTIVIRPFNVYGPGLAHGIVAKIVSAIQNKEPIQIHAPGRQLRTFLHLEDFLRALDSLILKLLKGGRGIYNVGSNDQVELVSLAKSACHAFGCEPQIVMVETAERHAWWKLPALNRIKADAKWQPRISIRNGLFRLAGR